MFGKGMVQGLALTFRRFFSRHITVLYPEERPALPERSHGLLRLDGEKCIACGLCARQCPNSALTVCKKAGASGKGALAAHELDLSRCLFCGLCVEACPAGALSWRGDFELACYRREDLRYRLWPPRAAEKGDGS